MLLRPATLAVLTALTLGAPLAASADNAPAPQIATRAVSSSELTSDHATPAAPEVAPKSDSSLYAQREAQHQDASKFKGGSVVVVGVSGGALLVILILILVLV
jgi:hypothetical protein